MKHRFVGTAGGTYDHRGRVIIQPEGDIKPPQKADETPESADAE